MLTIPPSVELLFRAAGWFAARQIEVDPRVMVNPLAASLLAEFGGLHVGQTGAGVECARSDIEFGFQDLGWFDAFGAWRNLISRSLTPVADLHHQHGYLLVDTEFYYAINIIDFELVFHGASFGEAVKQLLLGLRPRPIFHPGQSTQQFYGELINAEDPQVIHLSERHWRERIEKKSSQS